MIGSLLYYALYPLSRYLTRRRSETLKSLPPAVVDGKPAWNGAPATTRRFNQSQTTLLDQWLSPCGGTMGETKEWMKEPTSEKEADMRLDTDKEQLMAVLHEETNGDAASDVDEISAVMQKETEKGNGQEQEKVQLLEHQSSEITKHHYELHVKQNAEDGSSFPTEAVFPEQAIGAQFEGLQIVDNTQQNTSPVQGKLKIPGSEESVAPAEPSIQETTCPLQKVMQSLEESMTSAQITECWDEYVVPVADEMHGGESSSMLVFSSLLSDTQSNLKLQHGSQTSWHFPAGPGLTEEVQCPPWQFPAASYYPATEQMLPIEVMWRVWEEMDESATAAEPFPFTKASKDFTVMSYNILADDLLQANQELYTYCPLEVLDWNYRCSLLLDEIQKWEPDILCLQEVQENHYYEQLCPVLSQMGYTCVYKRRTGTKTDGCATCYRSSCFSEVSNTTLEFFRPETELLDRHNVGIVLLLRPLVTQGSVVKAMGPPLCVANTHLLFNPGRGDVKLAQLAIMLSEIDSVVKYCKADGEHCNVILCGDFNSVPHMPLYQLITTGELHFQGLAAWKVFCKDACRNSLCNHEYITHIQQISGQQDMSHKAHCLRLFAPLWPSCLGITDSCQYTPVNDKLKSQKSDKGQYSHEFMLQLRFCPAACVRPRDLETIPGLTDNTPDASRKNESCKKGFRHTISHRLDLESVYKHILPGFGNPEVTTLHSEGGSTVDYIFYTPRRTTYDQNAGDFVSEGLKLIGSLSLLSEDVLWSMRGLPNHIFPSDHLSLLAKFQLQLNAV